MTTCGVLKSDLFFSFLQYAHRLAYLVGQSIHKEPSSELSDRLFFLQIYEPVRSLLNSQGLNSFTMTCDISLTMDTEVSTLNILLSGSNMDNCHHVCDHSCHDEVMMNHLSSCCCAVPTALSLCKPFHFCIIYYGTFSFF